MLLCAQQACGAVRKATGSSSHALFPTLQKRGDRSRVPAPAIRLPHSRAGVFTVALRKGGNAWRLAYAAQSTMTPFLARTERGFLISPRTRGGRVRQAINMPLTHTATRPRRTTLDSNPDDHLVFFSTVPLACLRSLTAVDRSAGALVQPPVRRTGGPGVSLGPPRGGGCHASGSGVPPAARRGPAGELQARLDLGRCSRHATRHRYRLRQLVLWGVIGVHTGERGCWGRGIR